MTVKCKQLGVKNLNHKILRDKYLKQLLGNVGEVLTGIKFIYTNNSFNFTFMDAVLLANGIK